MLQHNHSEFLILTKINEPLACVNEREEYLTPGRGIQLPG